MVLIWGSVVVSIVCSERPVGPGSGELQGLRTNWIRRMSLGRDATRVRGSRASFLASSSVLLSPQQRPPTITLWLHATLRIEGKNKARLFTAPQFSISPLFTNWSLSGGESVLVNKIFKRKESDLFADYMVWLVEFGCSYISSSTLFATEHT